MATQENRETTLAQLQSSFNSNDSREIILEKLQTLPSQLLLIGQAHQQPDNTDIAQKLLLKIAECILPREDIVDYDASLDETPSPTRVSALKITKQIGYQGLTIISQLRSSLLMETPINTTILVSIITYTNANDPWTDASTILLANDLLSKVSDQLKTESFIIKDLLTDFIRPLFLKSKRIESITSTGRKAMPTSAPPSRYDAAKELDHANHPWRYEVVYTVTILGWAVDNITPELIKPNLHLILPPLLHLLDTSSHTLRHRGLLLLPSFFTKLTPQLLTQTGLGSVFSDAITPTLMFLPTLTPLQESLLLVSSGWDAIFSLHDVWFTSSSITTISTSTTPQRNRGLSNTSNTQDNIQRETQRIAFLLTHLRDSLLQAWSYTYPSHPPLLALLLHTLSTLICKLGMHTTKHLKDIIPIISSVTFDPFVLGTSDGRIMVREAIGVLREVILACWMRICGDEVRRMEILRVLVGVWKGLKEEESSEVGEERAKMELEVIKKDVMIVGRVFVKAVEAGKERNVKIFRKVLRRLEEVDPGIEDLFRSGDVDVDDREESREQ